MYSPEIYSWDVEDTLVLESSVNERCDEKHESLDDKYKGRLGGGTNADHPHVATHNFSRKKAAHSTVGSERVQKNHRKKMLADDKTNKGRTVHNDIAAKVTAKSFNVYRISQPRGSKDRHSKVFTSKGPRDRRMRLSVATAIRLYDLQEKLGLDQPSKTVEWLLRNAQPAILDLPLSAYSNSTGQETSLQSQNLNHLDLYGNILAENSLPASTTESNSNRDAQEGETSTAVVKRRRRDIANPSERKAHRTQARERARQRTREKYSAYESRQLIDHLKTFGLVKKSLGASSSLVQDSILSGCSNSHSSVSHPLSEIRSSLRTTVQQECSSQQSLGSLSCSNLAILSEKSTPDFVPGYFPLSVPCTCCVQCSGLECISEGQSTSNKETLQVADTRNICLIKPFEAHQSSHILTAYSPISCFPSPPFQLLDGGYYAQDCPVVNNCQ